MENMINITLPYGEDSLEVRVPSKNIAWIKSPNDVPGVEDETEEILNAIRNPIGMPNLKELVEQKGKNVVILIDDMTRATPQHKILPILLDELNAAGVEDSNISAIVCLGTHRKMSEEEILKKVGPEVKKRIKIENHDCMDNDKLIQVNNTDLGTPVLVNKKYFESDISIAVGNIIPHMYAGWSGGAKMIQPGVCGAATTGETHYMAAENVHSILGHAENPVRKEIENIARITGLTMIVNTILNKNHEIVKVVAGDFVKAHRAALPIGEKVYCLEIEEQVDIIIASANPAYLDFWQSIKAFNNCGMGVKKGGTLILCCHDIEGIAPDHKDLEYLGTKSRSEAKESFMRGEIKDKVALATYLAMAVNRERMDTYIISEGISRDQSASIGLGYANSVEEALKEALKKHGAEAKIGIVTHGADIYFKVKNSSDD